MRLLVACLLVCLCAPLAAQDADGKARRIIERPEYKGYRVERRPDPTGSDSGTTSGQDSSQDGGDAGQDGGSDGGSSRRGTESSGPRRGTGADGPSRGSGGGGGGSGLSLPGWIATLFEIVAWVVLIAVTALALFFIVKALLGIKRKPKQKSDKSKRTKKKATEGETEPVEADDDLAQVFEDALEVALREYKQALAAEDFAAATLLAYRIFWLRAGWRGCVENTDVRTWRDALRMVRAAERRQEVRALLPMVERVRYADYVPNKGEFNSWSLSLERIEPSGVLR